jgi:hypothetical protein
MRIICANCRTVGDSVVKVVPERNHDSLVVITSKYKSQWKLEQEEFDPRIHCCPVCGASADHIIIEKLGVRYIDNKREMVPTFSTKDDIGYIPMKPWSKYCWRFFKKLFLALGGKYENKGEVKRLCKIYPQLEKARQNAHKSEDMVRKMRKLMTQEYPVAKLMAKQTGAKSIEFLQQFGENAVITESVRKLLNSRACMRIIQGSSISSKDKTSPWDYAKPEAREFQKFWLQFEQLNDGEFSMERAAMKALPLFDEDRDEDDEEELVKEDPLARFFGSVPDNWHEIENLLNDDVYATNHWNSLHGVNPPVEEEAKQEEAVAA